MLEQLVGITVSYMFIPMISTKFTFNMFPAAFTVSEELLARYCQRYKYVQSISRVIDAHVK